MSRPRSIIRIVMPATVLAALLACAGEPGPNAALEQARENLIRVSADPAVVRYAPVELRAAREAFVSAERGWRGGDEESVTTHKAYMALRQADIAQDTARLRRLEEDLSKAQAAIRDVPVARAIDAVGENPPAREPWSGGTEIEQRRGADGIIVTLGDALFMPNSADLDPRAGAKIDKLADLLKQSPGRPVRIEGHSDDLGDRTSSLDLSRRRADAVQSALVDRGVDPTRLAVHAYGESYPVASNETPLGRQLNRRVEVVILDQRAPGPEAAGIRD